MAMVKELTEAAGFSSALLRRLALTSASPFSALSRVPIDRIKRSRMGNYWELLWVSGQTPSFIEFLGERGGARVPILSLGIAFRRCNSGSCLITAQG